MLKKFLEIYVFVLILLFYLFCCNLLEGGQVNAWLSLYPKKLKKGEISMPNGHGPKEYGEHQYADHDGTSDCKHGCGCWMGPTRSGGPTGLDPFGKCPNNPEDGKLLGRNADYDYVVTERIQDLSSRLYKAEDRLKRVKPSKVKLADELASVRKELFEKNQLLVKLQDLIRTDV